jgi:hypothetical protein
MTTKPHGILDAVTANTIERHEWGHLGPNDACGFRAIAGVLVEARSRNLRTQRLCAIRAIWVQVEAG